MVGKLFFFITWSSTSASLKTHTMLPMAPALAQVDGIIIIINRCIYFSFCFSFGIKPTKEKEYHRGVMTTTVDDCQFVCIAQDNYYDILSAVSHHTDVGNNIQYTVTRVKCSSKQWTILWWKWASWAHLHHIVWFTNASIFISLLQ